MTIGLISLDWFPRYGGAVIYAHRLLRALRILGHKTHVATATACDDAAHAGDLAAFRPAAPVPPDDHDAIRAWCLGLGDWLRENSFTHVLVNPPLTRMSHAWARELYALVRECGSLVGAIHHDLGRDVAAQLSWEYAMLHSWDAAAERVLEKIRAHIAERGEDRGYFEIESPFYSRPDFVVACSEWSGRFIDPLRRHARFVLHPLVDEAGVRSAESDQAPAPVDISFINPLAHKGVQTLVELIRRARPDWRFRVLQGGYGNGLNGFLADIHDSDAHRAGRVEILPYCRDMNGFYDRTGMLLFPSLYEGYGLAAVEPLYRGTPVVAREYPAIVEGVGDGARLVPFASTGDEWFDAVSETLANKCKWAACAHQRAAYLREREQSEMRDFVDFLEAL